MMDTIGLAFDAVAFGLGSLAVGYMAWQLNTHVRQTRMGTLPWRAARAWKWRIVLGLCASAGAMCFGFNGLLLHFGIGALDWLLIAGGLAAGVGLVPLLMIHNPESFGGSRRRAPDDDDTDDDIER